MIASQAFDAVRVVRSRRIPASVRAGIRYGGGAAIGLWAGDVVVLARAGSSFRLAPWLTGLGAAFFVAVTTGVVVGVLLGAVLTSAGRAMGSPLQAWWPRFRRGEAEARVALVTHVLAVFALAGIWCWLAYRLPMALLVSFARPDSMAWAMVVSHFVFALTLALAWPWTLGVSRRIVGRAWRLPRFRSVLRPWRVALFVATGIVLGAGAFAATHWVEVTALPWHEVLPIPGLFVGLGVTWALARATRPRWLRVRRVVLAVTGAAFVLSFLAAIRLRPESTVARRLAFDLSLSGSVGYAAWTEVLDFDRDGQLNVLGGGDCAPFDRHRYTGAPEIPNNGIDEDCDGEDLHNVAAISRHPITLSASALPARPSIILITVDGLAAERVDSFTGERPLMPALKALEDRSVSFVRAFSQGPSTRLSFPSMFTSRYDTELSFVPGPHHPHALAASERQLQDMLDDIGYNTAAVIPNSYFDRGRWPSVTRGFQHVDSSAIAAGKHDAVQVTDAALRILAEPRDNPLYLWVHYYDAHAPYMKVPGVEYDAVTEEALYEAELTFIDHEMARLFTAIEDRSNPTFYIVSADHGTVFHPDPATRHGHYGSDLYTATLHVPLIIGGLGIQPRRVDTLASTLDIQPTISDLVRNTKAPPMEGYSLLPEVLGHPGGTDRLLFHELNLPERSFHGVDSLVLVSVRDANYDLILDRDHGTYELYAWRDDYFERFDRYEDESRTPEVAHLRSLLGAFVHEVHHIE